MEEFESHTEQPELSEQSDQRIIRELGSLSVSREKSKEHSSFITPLYSVDMDGNLFIPNITRGSLL